LNEIVCPLLEIFGVLVFSYGHTCYATSKLASSKVAFIIGASKQTFDKPSIDQVDNKPCIPGILSYCSW
jgi:hypothetical protein